MNQILAYHSIDQDREDALSVKCDEFERQMAHLRDQGYEVVSLEKYFATAREGQPIPRKWMVLTFDDGMRDFYDSAFPILKRNGFHATVFMIADMIQETGHSQRAGFELLNRGEMLELRRSGLVSFGSHTNTHRHLDRLSLEEVAREVRESKATLERMFEEEITSFCYPAGKHSREVLGEVLQAGYSNVTLTPRRGQVNYLERSGRVLLRTGIYRQDSMAKFKLKLSAPFSALKRVALRFSYY